MAARNDEHARLAARSYQWLTSSQRRRLNELDVRATVQRYPWLARLVADGKAARHDAPEE